MRTTRSWMIRGVAAALLAAAVACTGVAFWFEYRKHELSGVPGNHFAVDAGGRRFYVPRGGGPVEERPQVPLTDEQYRLWKENDEAATRWALSAAVCWLTGITILCFAAGRRRKEAASMQAPKPVAAGPAAFTTPPQAPATRAADR